MKARNKFYFHNHAGREKAILPVGQSCYFKTAQGPWISGMISKQVSDRSYMIRGIRETECRRNCRNIRVSKEVECRQSSIYDEQTVSEEVSGMPVQPEISTVPDQNRSVGPQALIQRPHRQTRLPEKFRDLIVYYK